MDLHFSPEITFVFLTKCFVVTAVPGSDYAACSMDITKEIRRGDAVLICESWFRVDCRIEGSRSNQPERAKPPLTVSSVESHDVKGRNIYCKKFDESTIPLDGDFDGIETFTGKALKHGCSNDLRDMWKRTAEQLQPFMSETGKFDAALENELIRLKLLTRPGRCELNSLFAVTKNLAFKQLERVSIAYLLIL